MIDVIIVGGGHAGIEASYATSKLNKKTVLITGDLNRVGFMSCNPSIGGPAKGVVVREIDALGGIMAKIADKAQIQMKMLNRSKGPAVWALRAQIDKVDYPKMMLEVLRKQRNLTLIENLVTGLIVKDNKIIGVKMQDNQELFAKIVILTTGTYLASKVLIGKQAISMGPDKQPTTYGISKDLEDLGFRVARLKTGTPARIKKESIDFSKTIPQYGDKEYETFSFDGLKEKNRPQELCYLTHTNLTTHQIINANLDKSAMYGGAIHGTGPRYCPSIEDKVVRFHTKQSHQVFLEPETLSNDEFYLQGLSTSMPKDVQEAIIHSVKGLENAQIIRYAYAIEYDAIDPKDLYPSLETTLIENLFCAGQINGTSGYEEAAAQGLIAGINASLKLDGKEPLILKRNEAYIGVLIDDLVSKGIDDPYRLLTSRAEFRLLLRHDNADLRLREYGYKVGLVEEKTYNKFLKKKSLIEKTLATLNTEFVFPNEKTNMILKAKGYPEISQKMTLFDLLKRPNIDYHVIKEFLPNGATDEVLIQVEIMIKYAGYIDKANKEASKMIKVDEKLIPLDINYDAIQNIASEARDKLKRYKPKTIGQASRISGVNPSDISVLLVYLRTLK